MKGQIGWAKRWCTRSQAECISQSRRLGIATSLLLRGEAWMVARGMTVAATDTALGNSRLIQLFEMHGYRIIETAEEMVRLSKPLR
jgi:hypothetical protein